MFVFSYSKQWADLVVGQLAAMNRKVSGRVWGYGCLVVGKEFEGVCERNWLEINRTAGPFLHIFTLLPPPIEFLGDRIQELKRKPPSDSRDDAIAFYTNLLCQKNPPKEVAIKEKVQLLSDLRSVGLATNQYADFLFFNFRNLGEGIDIDVVAAKSVGILPNADDRVYLQCIERMALMAKEHYERNSDVWTFVKALTLKWDIQVALNKSMGLLTYIKDFIQRTKGIG